VVSWRGLVGWGFMLAGALACQRLPTSASPDAGPTRLAILDPAYGAHPDHPEALAPGDRLASLSLPLADGGTFELADARAAGPVVIAWVGGAEHESLSAWVRELDHAIVQLDERGATLVFVRPLGPEAALRWAIDLGLQTTVTGDPDGELGAVFDLGVDATALDFALLVLSEDGRVVYRKLGGRRPELAELLAVLDGEAEALRCCPGACVGAACESGGGG
jgi:peroxiredoxin